MECLALALTFRTKASTLTHSDLCPLRYRLSGARMRTHFLGRLKSSPHGDRKGSPLLYTVGTLGMRRSRGVTTLAVAMERGGSYAVVSHLVRTFKSPCRIPRDILH